MCRYGREPASPDLVVPVSPCAILEFNLAWSQEFYSDELVEGVEAGPAATTTPTEDLQKLVHTHAR